MWAAFSSTSPDINTTKAFLRKLSENKEKKAMGGSSGREDIEMTENFEEEIWGLAVRH